MELPDIQDGYRGLANYLGPHLDSGKGIFRRFSNLNTLNILYMQSELMNMEQDLKVQAYMDDRDPNSHTFARSVREMKRAPDSAQWRKILEVRELLEIYNKTLKRQAELSKLSRARNHDGAMISHWIRHEKGGNKFLSGCEARPWMSSEQHDLVALSSRSTDDVFTRWFEESVLPWLHWLFLRAWKKPMPGQENTGIVHYSKAGFKRMARVLNVMLSALLPSITVLGLYFIKSPLARLAAIIGFSAAFSLALALFTKARPVEVFAATAAFASVQVVFVGGTNTNDQMSKCECPMRP